MAEFVFKDMVEKEGLSDKFLIKSSATSYEEVGNSVHRGTVNKLKQVGIVVKDKFAEKLMKSDYDKYDYFLAMDGYNIMDITRIFGGDRKGKVFKLLDFTNDKRDVLDPWYTGNFDATYNDILSGTKAFLKYLNDNNKI